MIDIHVFTIPRGKQRYNTSGDWQWQGNKLTVAVDERDNLRDEMLIAIHEIVEAFLCRMHGIEEKDVTKFDMDLDRTNPDLEPGDQANAPYHKEHKIASLIENFLIQFL